MSEDYIKSFLDKIPIYCPTKDYALLSLALSKSEIEFNFDYAYIKLNNKWITCDDNLQISENDHNTLISALMDNNDDLIHISYYRFKLNGYTYSIYWSLEHNTYCFSSIDNPESVNNGPIRKFISLKDLLELILNKNTTKAIQKYFKEK